MRSATGWLSLQAEVDLGGLIRNTRPADLRLGLAAVVAEVDGPTSYWALVHPAEAPDFHHDDGFLLTMVPESASGSFEEPAA